MKINILTDTCGDLTEDMARDHNIELLPILVYDEEDNVYEDRFEIKPEDLYKEMRKGKLFKTAQVQPFMLQEAFRKCAEIGETCIYISFSSGLSGSYQTSILMKNEVLEEYPDAKIEVIDTKCVTLGSGMVALYASKLRDKGYGFEDIVKKVMDYSQMIEHVFTVDDLDYLFRGGRLSRTSAFVGGLLKVKPILESREGKLVAFEKERGRKKSIKRVINLVGERGNNLDKQTVYIVHSDAEEEAIEVRESLIEKYGVKDAIIKCLGSAITTHTGLGLVGIVFSKEHIDDH